MTLSGGDTVNADDVAKLKAGLSRGCTFYDSSAKAGVENELLLWVQLKPGSKLVLPSFVELVTVGDDAARTIDLSKVAAVLARPHVQSQVESIEIYYDSAAAKVTGAPVGAVHHEIHQ